MADGEEKKELTPEQKAAVARSMSRAGISQRYGEGRSLSEFGKAGSDMIARIVAPEFIQYVNGGQGFCISGKDPNRSYDFAVMTARAMRIVQLDIRVVNLISLSEYLTNADEFQDDRFHNFDVAKGLVVTRFAEPMDTLPLKRAELYKIENFLYGLMEENFSVSVQYSGSLKKAGWWSDYFLNRLKAANMEIDVT